MVFSSQLLRLRFAASRSAFETAVGNISVGQPPPVPTWIGLYQVQCLSLDGDGTVEFVTGNTWIDPCGFEFSPNTSRLSHGSERQIAPNWYVVEY